MATFNVWNETEPVLRYSALLKRYLRKYSLQSCLLYLYSLSSLFSFAVAVAVVVFPQTVSQSLLLPQRPASPALLPHFSVTVLVSLNRNMKVFVACDLSSCYTMALHERNTCAAFSRQHTDTLLRCPGEPRMSNSRTFLTSIFGFSSNQPVFQIVDVFLEVFVFVPKAFFFLFARSCHCQRACGSTQLPLVLSC